MAKIAYLLLAHTAPASVAELCATLTAAGDRVAVHFDRNAPSAEWRDLQRRVSKLPGVVLVPKRVRCGWGQWSLVRATIEAARCALAQFEDATHFYLISGDCRPITSAKSLRACLDAADVDHIETVDFFTSGWIKTGLREERLIYRHWANERDQAWAFYSSLWLQRRLGLERRIPRHLQMRIGSQWWCLRRTTVEQVVDLIARDTAVIRFFRTTWIPDETFFQTLVPHLVPEAEIQNRCPTFLMFSDYGLPVTLHNDHAPLLQQQPQFFARKISRGASQLCADLARVYASDELRGPVVDTLPARYRFQAARGRRGTRFGIPFHSRATRALADNRVTVIAAKKWHVGKRLAAQIGAATGAPWVGYLFQEEATPLPDLGGAEAPMTKRRHHPLPLIEVLLHHYGKRSLILCIDPSDAALLAQLCDPASQTRVLDLDCALTDGWLLAHARRLGLLPADATLNDLAPLQAAMRDEVLQERTRLNASLPQHLWTLRESDPPELQAKVLADILEVPQDVAQTILSTPRLFQD